MSFSGRQKSQHFVLAYFNGTYSNRLIIGNISKKSKKLFIQRNQIEKYLKNKGAKNYWVNTAGFSRLFTDLD